MIQNRVVFMDRYHSGTFVPTLGIGLYQMLCIYMVYGFTFYYRDRE
jgi:hypothetical protein